jgi:primosomal protein N'
VNQILRLSYHLQDGIQNTPFRVLGPAPCVISKERGQFRWNLYVKGPTVPELNAWLLERLKSFKKVKITLTIDVDPQ